MTMFYLRIVKPNLVMKRKNGNTQQMRNLGHWKKNIWEFVNENQTNGNKILGNKWEFRVKKDGTYKARPVARGCEENNMEF